MLSILETRCGTSGTHASHAARVAAMMTALAKPAAPSGTTPDDWFRSSFANDPWATAAELLSCRDELLTARISAGLSGHPPPNDPLPRTRLQALTALTDNPDIPSDGIPDRIMNVLHELRSAEFCTLKPLADYRIVVEQPDGLVPPVWCTVFAAVTAAGAVVEYRDDAVPAAPAAPSPSLTLLTASDEWQAAEHVAAFLARLEERDPAAARRLALVVTGDATALDWTLQRWGVPVTGRSGVSAARWGVQILPAFLATLWSPPDPQAIASFLSLASSLVPAVVSGALIHALSEHPGTGGPKMDRGARNDRRGYRRGNGGVLRRPLCRGAIQS